MAAPDHACHFYAEDAGLATTVASFLAPAFRSEDAVIAIGTRAHLSAIEQRLRSEGHPVDAVRTSGRYVTMDVELVIPALLRNGLPTQETFDAVVGAQVAKLAERHGHVRAFGEIVSVLWSRGKQQAAMRLEELWNEALGYHPLSLICGYSLRGAWPPVDEPGQRRIMSLHSRLIAADGD
jgi:MEDS: MEthanogen/methylotroph, DcmR Sensory domain